MQQMERMALRHIERYVRAGDHLSCVKLATRLLESHPSNDLLEQTLLTHAAALSFSPEVREVVQQSRDFLQSSSLRISESLQKVFEAAFTGRVLH